jgi:hypothetical protein
MSLNHRDAIQPLDYKSSGGNAHDVEKMTRNLNKAVHVQKLIASST